MLHLAFLSFIRRPLTRLILLFLIALACALPVFLLQTAIGLYDGINRAVSPFPILVGAKGSSYQLVLNTVFLRDKPIGNITHDDMEKLASDPHTEAVYPLAFGDNYRGFRIAGTNADIFDLRPDKKKGPWLSIAEGRCFAEEGDVVIGSETARLTGLRIGDTFHSVHGASAKGRAHNHTLKVVGILAPVKGPYDTAILTDIRDVWEAHGTAAEAQKEVTALLVVPKGYKEAMQLLSLYQRQKDVQMLFPSQTIISLYAMVGQTKDFWGILTACLLSVSILITPFGDVLEHARPALGACAPARTGGREGGHSPAAALGGGDTPSRRFLHRLASGLWRRRSHREAHRVSCGGRDGNSA